MSGRTCAAPGCDNPVVHRPGRRGRPPIYCSLTCRPSRQGPAAEIRVEVDQGESDDGGAGRVWTVTVRRGRRSVVVGRDLGRFSATLLADDLRAVLHPRSRQEGDAID